MKLPLSLLRTYITIDEPLSVIAEMLTLLGIEVDVIENEHPRFSKIVAAEVQTTQPHPSSDHLQLAQVFDGARTWSIVCGAKNCRPGLKTAFAQIGAVLIDEHSHERKIVETTIRGSLSQGMLCSAEELGIPGDNEGILELPLDIPNGQDLAPILADPILELSLTPNLGHCLSALGIARELSAVLKKPIHHPKIALTETPAFILNDRLTVSVQDPLRCPRYLCRLIENVKIGPSPFWLKQILLASGLRPINNVVDITNYILLKTGQPLHAFDYDKIDEQSISVQTSETAQSFVGLDEITREIPAGTLLICDARKTLAIAGIIGSQNSSISEKTHTIVLEAAFFDSLAIRKTCRQIKLTTESSQRFEKGIDLQGIPDAINEAAHLITQLCQGRVAQGMIDIKTHKIGQKEITLRIDRVNHIIGTKLSQSEIEDCLKRIGCKLQTKDDRLLHATIPSYRNDLALEIDLIKEVARIYGYNNIDFKTPLFTNSLIPNDSHFDFEREIRCRLIAEGLQEVVTCNLIGPKLANIFPSSELLTVQHSKTEDYSILRPSLLPTLLEIVQFNLSMKNDRFNGFEIGRVHLKQNNTPIEIPMLGIFMYGKNRPHHWDRKPTDVDFFDLKGTIEILLEALSIPNTFFQSSSHSYFHPYRQADLHANGLLIGSLGEMHPSLLHKLDIKQRIYFAEINLNHLIQLPKAHISCRSISQFPSTERDWTLNVPQNLQCETLFEIIRSFHSPLLEKAELIDLYISETKRNATIHFTYRDLLKTISFEEAEAVHEKLMAYVLSKLPSV